MLNPQLARRIAGYVPHIREDAYWNDVLTSYSLSELFDTLNEALGHPSDEIVSISLLFLCDLMRFAPDYGCGNESKLRYAESPLIEKLHGLVESECLQKRQQAVHTLGKTLVRSSARFLEEVFIRRKESDPILLSDLALENRWLGGNCDIGWVASHCLASSSTMTRWAGLNILHEHGFKVSPQNEQWNRKFTAVGSVCNDDFVHVASFARFMRDEMEFEVSLPQVGTPAEKKRFRKELDQRRPLSFDFVVLAFTKKLENSGGSDYKADELITFVDRHGHQLAELDSRQTDPEAKTHLWRQILCDTH